MTYLQEIFPSFPSHFCEASFVHVTLSLSSSRILDGLLEESLRKINVKDCMCAYSQEEESIRQKGRRTRGEAMHLLLHV
jgi:hypothetical protein